MLVLKRGGICSPAGFYSLGENIGIKKSKKDFCVIFTEKPANAAGVFTKNDVKGAPVIVSSRKIRSGKAQAIVVNSGIANVCTGRRGIRDAEETTRLVARELGVEERLVLVASTGLIGAFLPMGKIREGVKGIKKRLGRDSITAAEAIMTTDLLKKHVAVRVGKATIGAMAKGSGMINPNMATMLAFITTDADIPAPKLRQMLKASVDKSFNMVTVDNDTSTSDSVFMLANGFAKGKVDYGQFWKALDYVCLELAKMVAMDGEGATKLVEVAVKNAASEKQARLVAKTVVGSNLVKSAMFGNDPNWGRIVCAAGYSKASVKPEKMSVFIGSKKIVSRGIGTKFNEKEISGLLKKKLVKITIDLGSGKKSATAYGCDLTYDYVKINADYST